MKKAKGIGLYVGVFLAIVLAIMLFTTPSQTNTKKYSEVLDYFRNGQVSDFVIDLGSGKTSITFRDGSKMVYQAPNVNAIYEDTREIVNNYNLQNPDKRVTYDYKKPVEVAWLYNLIPYVILIVGMGVLWFFVFNQSGAGGGKAMSFGKARVRTQADQKEKITFDDVAGADEEKEELREIVEFLRDPRKFVMLGAKVPKGVLLMGPPGTGKTYLAKAVAGEAKANFFSISGSDFVEMYVGVGASRVRDLFDQAKKNMPCIVFIDEIDAVGRQRGAGLGGGHDEREQTLNQLLVEMDGFGVNEGVIIIAATNRPDVLDPALLRPGRFDRRIVVGMPDIKAREAILRVHARNKPLAPDVNMATIAKVTAGFTAADLQNLLNEAAILAARREYKAITMKEIEEAATRVIAGPEKRSRVITDKDKKITAYHEAGHAVSSYFLPTQDPVHEISIIPRGMAGGYTMSLPTEDRNYRTKTEMQESIVTLLGGRVAEKLVLEDVSTGASNDLERATDTARAMVMQYGFSDKLGTITFGTANHEVFLGRDFAQSRNYSETIASEIDGEIKEIVDSAYESCIDILSKNIDKLHRVAQYLFKNEKMTGDDFSAVMKGDFQPDEPNEQPAQA